MYMFIVILHSVACLSLILIVLLQTGKGGGLSGLMGGGGGSDQLFSAPSGMLFIKKVTVGVAIMFIVTSLFLTILTSRKELGTVTHRMPIAPVVPPPGQ